MIRPFPNFDARKHYHDALALLCDPTVAGDAKAVYLECARRYWKIMVAERNQADSLPSDCEPRGAA